MATKKNVLVTGSAGRLGQAAVKELLRQGHTVRGIDCRPTPGLNDAVVDTLQDQTKLLSACEGIDGIIHLAATPDDPIWPLPATLPRSPLGEEVLGVRGSSKTDNFLDQLIPNNLIPLYHVLEAARIRKITRVVLASSGQVVWDQSFDGPFPISNEAKPTPRWWYACAKLFLEAIGEAYAKQKFFSVVVARLGFCPRDAGQEAEIDALDRNQDVYLSPGDAGRFFVYAVTAERPIGSFDVVYPTSIPKHQVRFDLEPARRLLGFEPQDVWPQGRSFG
jgi:nucleoside-diphosphate-sugar epimerase